MIILKRKYFQPGFIGMLIFAMFLYGCVSGQGKSEAETARVYLYWPLSHVAEANHYIAAVNGKVVARLKAGSYVAIDQSLGPVVVFHKAGSALVPWGRGAEVGVLEGFVETDHFTAEKGQTYYVAFPNGEFVSDSSEALEEINSLTLLPSLK